MLITEHTFASIDNSEVDILEAIGYQIFSDGNWLSRTINGAQPINTLCLSSLSFLNG